MKLTLPDWRNNWFVLPKSKNTITQLVVKGRTLKDLTASTHLTGLRVASTGFNAYLTAAETDVPADEPNVLQTKKKPTPDAFTQDALLFKKWLKAEQPIAASPEEIAASWRGKFHFIEEDQDAKINGLRQPQLGAIYSILGHLKLPTSAGIVVLPTGTGKTETMLATLVANQCRKVLVVVPSDALRTQIAEKFITLGLLKEFGILDDSALYPAVGAFRQSFSETSDFRRFVAQSNVVVATMAILQTLATEELEHLSAECSHVFIDEAHHVRAKSWNYVKEHFDAKKIIQFTATPFRNDGQRLEGSILFNFPLSEAQKQGYYKNIEFLPVSVAKPEEADKIIADTAIARLRKDLAVPHNHILMARCATKERAEKVFQLYAQETDLQPVILYSGMPKGKENYQKIVAKQARIIVCVDMLGEGFDLPELKIAAFHDIRKSLPITLQLAGRFTRTKYDEQLGDACFIANIADPDVSDELDELYARDANWSMLLANMSEGKVAEEVDFKKLLAGFPKLAESKLPLNNIQVKLSTVVYKNKTDTWSPGNFKKGLPDFEKAFYKFDDLNREDNMLIVITATQEGVDWLDSKEVYQLTWRIILVYWETKNNLLFIHSSDNSSLYEDLAKAIIGDNAQLIKGVDVFKTFDGMHRITLQNVGLRNRLGKDIRFRMMVGRDLEEAISIIEKQKGEKAFVMGAGYEVGKKVNLGASYKGRIWTKRENDLSVFKKWCVKIGNKLLDPSIDPNQFLKETLVPMLIKRFPALDPVWIDWHEDLYNEGELYFKFELGTEKADLSCLSIDLTGIFNATSINFAVASDTQQAEFELKIIEAGDSSDKYPDYEISQVAGPTVSVSYGRRKLAGAAFFQAFPPAIWFVDGSSVSGNDYVPLKQTIGLFPQADIEVWDWTGVDLSAESQGVLPVTDSIQYHVIKELNKRDYDIIFDDDGSGEAADVVALKVLTDKIRVELYHLKYAKKAKVGNSVGNLYEVCGQAQRSMHWKHKPGDALMMHLLRREPKRKKGVTRSRFEKGTEIELEALKKLAKRRLPLEFEMIIVQPSLTKSKVGDEILKLLGVTQNFVRDLAGVSLRVIGSA
ncbi:DEAD/DEAH box helicase [Hymenobacter busanensis]|uniref:DEAD/DEAH box helicase n=1 Tax=Hymenobacter busanensis TaxID=2607656 RepID=A0AA88FID4_9BACT|nr:DEAD/DEAH box helicase family protein [Hymenobacter busanensis]KAA9325130.1 DEAD/DEAH box helicase [Hymenobacter busanensis]